MLRIAVCDNDQAELDHLTGGLHAYAAAHDIAWQSFTDPAALLDALRDGTAFDTAILDIIMPGVNGIRLGRHIREHHPEMTVIYTTSSRDFALEAFENHALRYLLKPVRQDDLFSALDLAQSLVSRPQETILIKGADGMVSVAPGRIVAVENAARAVRYILSDGSSVQTVSRRGKLDETIAPLPERPEFLKPHNSFWVNMHYIRELRRDTLLLDNGMEIPVSRNRLAEVKRSYLKFLATGGDIGGDGQ